MMVTPSSKTNEINEMTCYLYPCGLLFGTNIIISSIISFLTLFNPIAPVVPNLDYPTTYTVLQNTT